MTSRGRIGAVARQVYGDLVRRRSRLELVVAGERRTSDGIIIAAPYRSGSTLLRFVMDSHHAVACPPENEFAPHLLGILDDPRAMQGLADMGWESSAVAVELGRTFAGFYSAYADARGKERWCDKSPVLVGHHAQLARALPDARFLVLARHPLDLVASATRNATIVPGYVRAFQAPGDDATTAAARYWDDAMRSLLALLERPQRAHLVRYEDLCASPERVLRATCDFLELSWDPAMLRFNEHHHDFGYEAAKTRRTTRFEVRAGSWRAWEPGLVERCWQVVGETATRLGYGLDA